MDPISFYRSVNDNINQTLSNEELLDKLYARTVEYLQLTATHLESGNLKEYHKFLDKSITLIDQGLVDSLDVTTELGANLLTTYTSLMLLLVKANSELDIDLINQSIDIVKMLRNGFETANDLNR